MSPGLRVVETAQGFPFQGRQGLRICLPEVDVEPGPPLLFLITVSPVLKYPPCFFTAATSPQEVARNEDKFIPKCPLEPQSPA